MKLLGLGWEDIHCSLSKMGKMTLREHLLIIWNQKSFYKNILKKFWTTNCQYVFLNIQYWQFGIKYYYWVLQNRQIKRERIWRDCINKEICSRERGIWRPWEKWPYLILDQYNTYLSPFCICFFCVLVQIDCHKSVTNQWNVF